MGDPLSVAASIAGLVSLADLVFRKTISYIKTVKEAKDQIRALSDELQSLSGVLHTLYLRTAKLDAEEDRTDVSSFRPHMVESCLQMLLSIKNKLEKMDPAKPHLRFSEVSIRHLRWPFSASDTKDLVSDIERHKSTIMMVVSADTLSSVEQILSSQRNLQEDVKDINTHLKRRTTFETNLLSMVSKKKQEDVFRFFGSVEPTQRHQTSVELRHPGTGLWLVQSTEFQDWIESKNSKLWLSGIPGAGKTVLASVLIEETFSRCGTASDAVAYFYCDYKNERSQDPVNILGSLVAQLGQQNADCFELLCKLYDDCEQRPGSRPLPRAETLFNLLTEMASMVQDVRVIVDALDECGKRAGEVSRWLSRLSSDDGKHSIIKTALFSRDEVEIRGLLETDFVHMSIAARSGDLSLYVGAGIEQRVRDGRLALLNISLKNEIINALIGGADGMFRWASCQLDYLCELTTEKEIRTALKSLPPDLNSTYERILRRVHQSSASARALVQGTLRWIIHAKRPLKIKALCEALSIKDGQKCLDRTDIPKQEVVMRHCRSLIRRSVDSKYLELAHFTVEEYLTNFSSNAPGSDFDISPYMTTLQSSMPALAKTCLTYLNLDNFNTSLVETEDDWRQLGETFPFRSHAVRFWSRYAEEHWDDLSL